jgi:hypothetical protein
VVTSIEPLEAFYAADQSHQNYFERNPVCARSVEGEVGAGGWLTAPRGAELSVRDGEHRAEATVVQGGPLHRAWRREWEGGGRKGLTRCSGGQVRSKLREIREKE